MKNILVVSHERSGTHFLIDSIINNLNVSRNKSIDLPMISTNTDIKSRDEYMSWIRDFMLSHSNTHSQIFKSHHDYRFIEPFIDEISEFFEIIYIRRNILDVCTSCYHYFKPPHPDFPSSANFDEYLNIKPHEHSFDPNYSFEQYNSMIDRWYWHNYHWNRAGVPIVNYEELKTQFESTITRISQQLNTSVRNIPPIAPPVSGISPRKGVIGDYKNLISPQQASLIDQRLRKLQADSKT